MRKWLFLLSAPALAFAEVDYNAFIDTYYAFDFNQPASQDRLFTTQPSRHNEFNVNLAYVDVVLEEDSRHARLALQHGTSVESNYAAEPVDNVQILQEAFVGAKLSDKLWVDGGIFFSHIGIESFIPKYNINYSRSFMADNVPYYSAGVRFFYEANEKETFQFQILNGWQNIQENNSGKALGFQYSRKLPDGATFTYNNFLGDEKLTTAESRFRTYHNFIFTKKLSSVWVLQSSVDIGTQAQEVADGVDSFWGGLLILGQKLTETSRLGYRFEYYLDRAEANIVTNSPEGFEVIGASTNYDREIAQNTLWRTELRGFYSKDKIYPQGQKGESYWNSFLVTSLSISF